MNAARARPCPYRDRATYPYQRQGGVGGKAINSGFLGDDVQTAANFAHLTDPDYAYTPMSRRARKNAKTPAWLNDPIYYHNRGNTTFEDESSTTGDFSGLDDLYTENPRVIAGMIDIYGSWIDRFGIDGYRIDTAKHVNPEFWRSFVPAMLERAKAKGIPNFHIFGEVTAGMEPGYLARWTKIAAYPAVLDFAFMNAVIQTVAENRPTRVLSSLFEGDVLLCQGGGDGGHPADVPRQSRSWPASRTTFGWRTPMPRMTRLRKRVELGHAMLLTLAACRPSIRVTNRVSRRRQRPGRATRTCSRARSPATTTTGWSAPPRPPRPTAS